MDVIKLSCSSCGNKLAITNDVDRFACQACGSEFIVNRGGGIVTLTVVANLPKLETCEIEFVITSESMWGNNQGYFKSKAIGEKGVYTAARSPVFACGYNNNYPDDTNKNTVRIYNEFVSQLVSEGWESTGGRGSHWWSTRFQRNTNIPRLERCEIFEQNVKLIFNASSKFVAQATGPLGDYVASEATFKGFARSLEPKNTPETKSAFKKVEADLLADGWKCVGVGGLWYQKKFERTVR